MFFTKLAVRLDLHLVMLSGSFCIRLELHIVVYMMVIVQCKAGPTLSGSFSIRLDLHLVVATVCCQAGCILSGGHCKLSSFIYT